MVRPCLLALGATRAGSFSLVLDHVLLDSPLLPRSTSEGFWMQIGPSHNQFGIAGPGSETGRIRFRRAWLQTLNSMSFFGIHRVPGRVLSELLSAYDLCAKANSSSLSQNSPSSLQNSVSSLFQNNTLETVFHPFPTGVGKDHLNSCWVSLVWAFCGSGDCGFMNFPSTIVLWSYSRMLIKSVSHLEDLLFGCKTLKPGRQQQQLTRRILKASWSWIWLEDSIRGLISIMAPQTSLPMSSIPSKTLERWQATQNSSRSEGPVQVMMRMLQNRSETQVCKTWNVRLWERSLSLSLSPLSLSLSLSLFLSLSILLFISVSLSPSLYLCSPSDWQWRSAMLAGPRPNTRPSQTEKGFTKFIRQVGIYQKGPLQLGGSLQMISLRDLTCNGRQCGFGMCANACMPPCGPKCLSACGLRDWDCSHN